MVEWVYDIAGSRHEWRIANPQLLLCLCIIYQYIYHNVQSRIGYYNNLILQILGYYRYYKYSNVICVVMVHSLTKFCLVSRRIEVLDIVIAFFEQFVGVLVSLFN